VSQAHAAKVVQYYLVDLAYLHSIGRIDDTEYNDLSNANNFAF